MGAHLTSWGDSFVVDDDLDDIVGECCWQSLRPRYRNKHLTSYVRGRDNKTKKTVLLHRLLVGAFCGEEVDHINGDGMDNRLCNLQLVTRTQNQQKRRPRKGLTTRGVHFIARLNKWQARLTFEGKRHSLGLFTAKEEAIKAYNEKAKTVHGKFAYLNELP